MSYEDNVFNFDEITESSRKTIQIVYFDKISCFFFDYSSNPDNFQLPKMERNKRMDQLNYLLILFVIIINFIITNVKCK